ncbi:MAG TPA: 2-isopropylmalate synthase [Candidatus Tectomicrobia bacterium]|nr:2-isopropylmalate synthase [Candidatus Tectomicrobia bacterium]
MSKAFAFLQADPSVLFRQPTREKHAIEAVDAPNLLRSMFPYHDVPKITFDPAPEVPLDPPEEIFITCTSFRDGQQARTPYTVRQIVDLYEMESRLSGPNGVIRQSEFFLYTEKDRQAVEQVLALGRRYPEVTSWVRANANDLKQVTDLGLRETGILTSSSDYHIFKKLGLDRRKAADLYLGVVRAAVESGIRPRCHLEDLTRADIYGFIVPFVQHLMAIQEDSGVPVKVRLCDTMGWAVPYPGASLPRSVAKLVHVLTHECGVPKAQLEWHGHNDFHKTLVNASTAWVYGCAGANGTLLGIGERTGNTPIEGLCVEYAMLMGTPNGMDLRVITEIADYYRREIKEEIPVRTPLVGDEFNTTAAGIHVDGMMKDPEIYNIFDTEALLNRPVGVKINDKSGAAGLAYWVNHYLGLTGEARLDKKHPAVIAMAAWVEAQYRQGRTTAIASEEMLGLIREHLPTHVRGREPEVAATLPS